MEKYIFPLAKSIALVIGIEFGLCSSSRRQ